MSQSPQTAAGVDALRLAGSLLLLTRAWEQLLRATSDGAPLNITELGVLGQIDRGVEQPSRIARALRLDPARVTHLTDRLVNCGYVERRDDPADRRRWQLVLTEAGRERLTAGRQSMRAAMETLLAGIGPDELSGLVQGLEAARRVVADLP
jgi:MarR family transcriptional regulator, transcriptional regulator for hemolysin